MQYFSSTLAAVLLGLGALTPAHANIVTDYTAASCSVGGPITASKLEPVAGGKLEASAGSRPAVHASSAVSDTSRAMGLLFWRPRNWWVGLVAYGVLLVSTALRFRKRQRTSREQNC